MTSTSLQDLSSSLQLYSNQARREDITEREECQSNVSHMMLTVTIMATLPAQFVQPVLSTLSEKLSDAVEVERVS